jgi:hypothetical protein
LQENSAELATIFYYAVSIFTDSFTDSALPFFKAQYIELSGLKHRSLGSARYRYHHFLFFRLVGDLIDASGEKKPIWIAATKTALQLEIKPFKMLTGPFVVECDLKVQNFVLDPNQPHFKHQKLYVGGSKSELRCKIHAPSGESSCFCE